jgi:hypothetical protein
MANIKIGLKPTISSVISMDKTATLCNVFLRNISAHNNQGISRFEYERRHDKSILNNVNNSHNRFDALNLKLNSIGVITLDIFQEIV